MGSINAPELLVVDFNNEEMKAGTDYWISASKDIRNALENHGCFIAIYDKVSPQLHQDIFKATADLFDLPTEIKVQNTYEKPNHGYVGQIPHLPLYESLGIDCANTLEGAQSFTNLMWPHGNQSFCETSMSFAKTLAELEKMVIKMLFESYGVDKYAESHVDATYYLLRLSKYRAPGETEATVAIPSHTDRSFTTILHQNHVSGLEIMVRDGEWITVQFSPSSFLVMAGDACKAWSNDRVLSPVHKVSMDSKGKETRYSTVLFSFLNKNVEVPHELVDDDHPLKYRPFDHIDLLKLSYSNEDPQNPSLIEDAYGV